MIQQVASAFNTVTEEAGRSVAEIAPQGRDIAQHGVQPPGEGRPLTSQAS